MLADSTSWAGCAFAPFAVIFRGAYRA
jgi:hypothetical protein